MTNQKKDLWDCNIKNHTKGIEFELLESYKDDIDGYHKKYQIRYIDFIKVLYAIYYSLESPKFHGLSRNFITPETIKNAIKQKNLFVERFYKFLESSGNDMESLEFDLLSKLIKNYLSNTYISSLSTFNTSFVIDCYIDDVVCILKPKELTEIDKLKMLIGRS